MAVLQRRGLLFGLLLVTACADKTPEEPVIELITPSISPANVVSTVSISGRAFYQKVTGSFDDDAPATFDPRFTATLEGPGGSFELEQLEWVDIETLRAVTPSNLAVGDYDLVVTGAYGRSNTLVAAYTVCGDDDGDGRCGCTDGDRDGYGHADMDRTGCANADPDCDDTLAAIHPGATETPDDDIDQDCSGADTITCILDSDMDGFGTALATEVLAPDGSCDTGEREASNTDDCDDSQAACTTTCTDMDSDGVPVCAGDCDDSLATGASCSSGCSTYYADTDSDNLGDLASPSPASCTAPLGHVANSSDCDDSVTSCTTDCTNADGDALALCAGDCDDSAATGSSCTSGCSIFYADTDSDGFGDSGSISPASCVAPSGYVADDTDCDDSLTACTTTCTDMDSDGVPVCAGDCDDSRATGASCSSGCSIYYADTDSDNLGDLATPSPASCTAPVGHVANSSDCDDLVTSCTTDCTNADGDALALCAGDCDDSVATGSGCTAGCAIFYADTDGDGFGDSGSISPASCVAPSGYVADDTDCDDRLSVCGAGCFPGNPSPDICDGNDQDCDAATDEDPEIVWYEDADGDAYGNPASTTNDCNIPVGYVADNTDCDDNPGVCGAACFPNNPAADVCDGDNQDCDGATDEDPELTWYQDNDGDTFGNIASSTKACAQPVGYVADSTDCDDSIASCGASCFPGNPSPDICDGDNQDCDGATDEDPDKTWYQDADGDTYGLASSSINACMQPMGYVLDNTDCADTPGSDPVCGGADGSFCNPLVSEGPIGDATCSDTADNDCDGNVDLLDPDCNFSTLTMRFDNQNVLEDLIDFPVLVTLTPANFNYALDPEGDDLVFRDGDGVTKLNHDIDTWNNGGTSTIWVKVPQIDADSTTDGIFLEYGTGTDKKPPNSGQVWNNFHAVWHLDETGTGANDEYEDSANNHDGTGGGGSGGQTPGATTGYIGGAQLFDGSNDRIEVFNSGSFIFASPNVTIEAWVESAPSGSPMIIAGKGGSPGGYRTGFESDGRFGWFVSGTLDQADNNPPSGVFTYVVVNWDGSNMRWFVNGVEDTNVRAKTGNIGASSDPFYIGRGPTNYEWKGKIDEVRVANQAWSAHWHQAQYRSMTDTYITYE